MATPPAQQAIQTAIAHHQAGRLPEAERIYRQILAQQPNHVDALNLLGVLAGQVGQPAAGADLQRRALALDPNNVRLQYNLAVSLQNAGQLPEAIAAFARATQLKPDWIEAHFNLAESLRFAGRFDEAIAAYQQTLRLRPDHLPANLNLGGVLLHLRRFDAAIDAFRRTIQFNPNDVFAYNNLGNVFKEMGRFDESVAAYSKALALKPDYAEAHYNLGIVLIEMARWPDAIAAFGRALQFNPTMAEASNGLGRAFRQTGQLDQAIAACRQAIQIKPTLAEAHENLGLAWMDKEQFDQAIAAYRESIRLCDTIPEVWSNLGNSLRASGRRKEAMEAYVKAVQLDPNLAGAHWNLASALLVSGDMQRGWPEYEWRLKCKSLHVDRDMPRPRWNGGELAGQTILLHAEQGLGDTIQFVRYAARVAGRGGKVILECQSELKRLLNRLPGVQHLLARGEELPPYDVHCPLPSLPGTFATRVDSIPADIPYLHADPQLIQQLAEKLLASQGMRRIGLVWAGNPGHENDRKRSIALAQLAPLTKAANNTRFYSLQKGDAANQAKYPPPGMDLIDPTADLHDFADTAALIQQLDLIISVDTSVAHLAGAMGKSVWLLLPIEPDWRWLLQRADSPWYPSMRLFRQNTPGDWPAVIERVAAALSEE